MRHAIWLAVLAAACLAAGPRPGLLQTGDPFVGSWKISLTPNGDDANLPGVKAFDETLTFTPTKLSTKILAGHGFGPADYTTDTGRYSPAKFNSTQNSDKEGKIVWEGFITVQDMQGTMVWTKKDGTDVHYDFTGKKS